jgi:murein DD-endopeptidase MepM/ murein hydrolase activator NlpD
MFQPTEIDTRTKALVLVPGCLIFIFTTVLLLNVQALPGGTVSPESNRITVAKEDPNHLDEKLSTTESVALGHTPRANVLTPPPSPPNVPTVAVGVIGMAVDKIDLEYLRHRDLLIPVAGKTANDFRDSFDAPRSEGRRHRAIDIMASQGTPVVAAADGKLKLHTSDKGGIMIYQTDSSGPYVYCYGHLQRYADGIHDGKEVRSGEVIGYVGDTGNAGPGNFHLHFGISKMSAPGKWSGGEAINPYPLLSE